MMDIREIVDHKINECNEAIQVLAISQPTGEPQIYKTVLPHAPNQQFIFQLGPIKEVGVNGVTNEVLLAVVLDRMRYFQLGQYACRENALAITKVEEALHWLRHRTRERVKRGVEGTSKP